MKLYSSFLVRCWLIHDQSQDERSLIDVEHVQTGGHKRVANLTEAEEWIFAVCRRGPTDTQNMPEREET